MFLTKYRPNRGLESTFDPEFFTSVSRWFDREGNGDDAFRLPMTNVHETDKEYVLTMEMPGVKKESIDVSIENDLIVITGGKSEQVEPKGLVRREIRSAKFRRSFTLDSTVDRDKISAKLKDGVLKVTLPKRADKVGRKVDIS